MNGEYTMYDQKLDKALEALKDKRFNNQYDDFIEAKVREGINACRIWKAICNVNGDNAISRPTVTRRVKEIKESLKG